MDYEHNHNKRFHKDYKKKIPAIINGITKIEEEAHEYKSEIIYLINKEVR